MGEPTKVCRKCDAEKLRSAFNRKVASPDGLQPACRECVSAYNRELYQRDPAKVRARNNAWAEANPDKTRAMARANAARRRVTQADAVRRAEDLWRSSNPERAREIGRLSARRRRARDPEGVREYGRQWREQNPDKHAAIRARRRARKLDAMLVVFTAEQLEQRLSMFPGCWMCGGPKEVVDHVKPLTKGGPHMLANLRPACKSCNSSKRSTWPLPPSLAQFTWRASMPA